MLWVLGLGCSEPVVVERPWSADPILLTISVHGHNYGLDTSNEFTFIASTSSRRVHFWSQLASD